MDVALNRVIPKRSQQRQNCIKDNKQNTRIRYFPPHNQDSDMWSLDNNLISATNFVKQIFSITLFLLPNLATLSSSFWVNTTPPFTSPNSSSVVPSSVSISLFPIESLYVMTIFPGENDLCPQGYKDGNFLYISEDFPMLWDENQ